MAIDTRVPRSRRALLAAGLGGLGASLLHALGRPAPAAAANGDPILAGELNTETLETALQQTNASANGLGVAIAVNGGTGTALSGIASNGIGVRAQNTSSSPTVSAVNSGAMNAGPALFASAGTSGTVASPAIGAAIHAVQTDAVPGRSAVRAESSGASNAAVLAYGGNGAGVVAEGATLGVRATNGANGTAILGVSGGDTVTPAAKIGIYGYANQDANARAVYGKSLVGTGVWGNSDTGRGLYGRSTAGTGVSAQSDTGRAVYGTTAALDKTALLGQNTSGGSPGVQGFSGGGNPPTPDAQTGVQGNSNLSTIANGVLGRSSVGTGVWGDTTDGLGVAGSGSGANSVGVLGVGSVGVWASGAWGIVVDGPSFFTTSGKVTITSGSSTTVTVPGGIAAESIGLAVLQTNRAGVWVRAVTTNVAAGTMTIYLNVAVSSSTTIGWFLVN
jgi:hypothetical protein